jgi:hypothetical protein
MRQQVGENFILFYGPESGSTGPWPKDKISTGSADIGGKPTVEEDKFIEAAITCGNSPFLRTLELV